MNTLTMSRRTQSQATDSIVRRLGGAVRKIEMLSGSPDAHVEGARDDALDAARECWIDAVPTDFGTFAQRAGNITLSGRQERAFREAGLFYPTDIISPTRTVQEAVLVWGKGSGKDRVAALFIAYMAYVVLNLRGDPAVRFGLAPRTPLHVLNVAPSEDLARQVFFAYLRQDVGCDLIRPFNPVILADEVRFPSANLTLYSKHSRASGLDGYNLLGFVLDEADEFLDNEKRSNAEIVHNILRSSANTRLRNRWVGIVISYPRTRDGFMMRLYSRASGDPTFYADLAATWDVRTDVSRDDPGIASDYANDPDDAAARYECRPMEAVNAFFELREKIDAAVDHTRSPSVVAVSDQIVRTTRPDGSTVETIGGSVVSCSRRPGSTYFLAGDGGLSGDSFAISLMRIDQTRGRSAWICPDCHGHGREADLLASGDYEIMPPYSRADTDACCGVCGESITNRSMGTLRCDGWARRRASEARVVLIDGRPVTLPRVYEEALIEFRPERATRPGQVSRPVNFASVQNVCRDIIRQMGVVQARFDPWNTAQMVQGLQNECDVDSIPFSQPEQYRRARLVKSMLYADLVSLLPNEKRDKEWRQLVRVREKIDHPEGGSKDMYDAESAAIWMAARWSSGDIEVH